MLSYMIGKIISINKKSITLESNWTGYVINVTNPESFELGKVKKIYLHKHSVISNKNNLVEDYYGFTNYEEKELFLKLITLNGIGPKTAAQILRNDINLLKTFILNKDIKSLSSLTSINERIARQLVDGITITSVNSVSTSTKIAELVSALKSLGYEKREIDLAISDKHISESNSDLSDLISNAIKIIASGETNGTIKAQ